MMRAWRRSGAVLLLGMLPVALAGCPSMPGLGSPIDAADRVVPKPLARKLNQPLSSEQQRVAGAHGFVIAQDQRTPSFHLGYTALFKAHQPVYISADALLHAWHRSYDAILKDVETASLIPSLELLLAELREGLAGSRATTDARADLDLYLGVAASLLKGEPLPPIAGAQAEHIALLVKAAEEAGNGGDGIATLRLFGAPMDSDFSQLKPRGHYTQSAKLSRYFQAMMWLGRTEIRIAEKKGAEWRVNRRALAATATLQGLLTPDAKRAWRRLDRAMGIFVGPPDAMSFPGLAKALAAAGELDGASDQQILDAFSPHARQRIGSQLLHRDHQVIGFLPLGQRYVFDSHVLSEVTYGKLPQKRMMPNPLDVAAAVFHHPRAKQHLAPELQAWGYEPQLDGIAARRDAMGTALWEGSLAHLWLSALGELSPNPARDAGLPPQLRSDAWGDRLLNTQLASWAEYRHDTILYAKQSYTSMAICGYPAAYVDPYPAFYAKMERLAALGKTLVGELDDSSLSSTASGGKAAANKAAASKARHQRIRRYFDHLAATSAQLRAIAERERQDQPITAEQLDFINRMVSWDGRHAGCTVVYEPSGWLADLHYDKADVYRHKTTIADVHTQPTDAAGNVVGKVLHVGTTAPRLLHATLDTCEGTRSYRGFVASYHEHITGDFKRLTDEEWRTLSKAEPPPAPPWLERLIAP